MSTTPKIKSVRSLLILNMLLSENVELFLFGLLSVFLFTIVTFLTENQLQN